MRLLSRLDQWFHAEAAWPWKMVGAAVVGLVLAVRVAWLNRQRFTVAAHIATLLVVPAGAVLCAVALTRADSVRRRVLSGEQVGYLSRILFGAGIWSLLLWVVGLLVTGFPLAVWLGSLTADRPAG